MLGACFSALAVLATTLVGLVVTAPPASAAPGDPFDPADAIVFVAQNIPTQLFRAVPDAGGNVSFTAEGDESDITYNAIAYNPADDYVWAVKNSAADAGTGPVTWPAGSIIRIGQGGVMTRVGTGTTIPAANVGLIGGDGYFYVNHSGGTEIRRIHPVTGAAAGSYTLPFATGAPDLTYANGYFWGVNGTGGIVRIALTPTPTVDVYPGILPGGGYGAAWTYGNGNLGFSRNNDGSIRQVQVTNPSAPTPTFTILSTQPGPASGNNDGTSSAGLPTDLAITKVGPTPLIPGDTVSYTLTVANNGAGNSSGFVVTDTVPAPLTNVASPTAGCTVAGSTVTCTSGPLLAGQSRDFTVTADVPPGQFLCVTNTASVLGNENDPVPGNNSASVESCPAPGLAAEKSTAFTQVDTPGQIITYDVTVRNTGPVTITDIVVTDPNADPGSVLCPLTALGPGQTMTCTAEHTVTQAELDGGGVLENTATVTGDAPGGPLPPVDTNTVPIPITQLPGISLVKSSDPVDSIPALHQLITYTFVATNTGNVTLDDVTITDPMPNLSTLVCDRTAPVSLAPNEQLTCTATYEVDQLDLDNNIVQNSAAVVGTPPIGQEIEATDSVTLPGQPDPAITVTKTADRVDVDAAGEVVTYTILATNTGNVTLSGVEVTDPMTGLSPLTCAPATPAVLAPGQHVQCTATYTVDQADLDGGGDLANEAEAVGNPPVGPQVTGTSNEVVIPIVQAPDLNLQKIASPGEVQDEGDVVTYTLTATNTGNVTLDGVAVSDPLPGLSPLTCNPAAPAALLPGEVLECTATYAVTQTDIDDGGVINQASVNGTPPGGTPFDSSSPPVTVIAVPNPSLVIAKTSSAPPFAVGDVVDYELHVRNDGNLTITGIFVDDPLLDAPATCPANQLLPGEDMTCTGSRTATQDDLDAGRIENVAHAEGILPSGQPLSSPPSAFTVPSVTRTPGLSITKSAGQSGFVRVGDVIDFSFLVTNTGNVTITDVAVVDPNLDFPATCPTTVLLPGESTTCTGSRTITQADMDAGELVNSATASGQDPTGSPVVSSGSTVRVPFTGSRPSGPGGPGARPRPVGRGGALPRTGGDSAALAAVGVLLLGLGAVMQLSRGAWTRSAPTAAGAAAATDGTVSSTVTVPQTVRATARRSHPNAPAPRGSGHPEGDGRPRRAMARWSLMAWSRAPGRTALGEHGPPGGGSLGGGSP